jgi:glycosyltransferase involved in cell wall biosynthesis
VSVVPLRFGGGTRIKILEALAHGVPVVSTSAGAEGLGLRHGEHALIADTADDLAAACVRLLLDREEGARLAAQGAALVAPHRAGVVRAGLVAELQARHRARSASTSA